MKPKQEKDGNYVLFRKSYRSVLHEKEFLFVFTGADTTGIGLEIDFCSTFKIKSKNKNWIKIRHSNIKYQKLAPGNGAVEMMRKYMNFIIIEHACHKQKGQNLVFCQVALSMG